MPLLNKMRLFYHLKGSREEVRASIFNKSHPLIKQLVFNQGSSMTREIMIILYYTLEWLLQVIEQGSDILTAVISPVMVLVTRLPAATILAND